MGKIKYMSKIYKVEVLIRDDRYDNVLIGEGSVEIDVDGSILQNNIPEISSKKLSMFKESTRLEVIIKDGEEKQTQE